MPRCHPVKDYHTVIPFQHKRSTKQAKHETKNKQKAKSCCSLLAYSGFRGYLKGESHSVFLGRGVVYSNRQTSGESASLPQYLGCNTVFDMRLRVTFLRRKTVSLQSNIEHRE